MHHLQGYYWGGLLLQFSSEAAGSPLHTWDPLLTIAYSLRSITCLCCLIMHLQTTFSTDLISTPGLIYLN